MLRVPSLVARVLIGEQQKFVACELQVTPSTVSGRYVRGLEDMGLSHDCIPLSIILAAQVWAGVVIVPAARRAFFEHEGQVYVVVSIARPATERMLKLSLAERHVAKCLIEGNARDAIAGLRRTSNHTVARQIHSIFEKERATGRFALVRRAAEQGCFG